MKHLLSTADKSVDDILGLLSTADKGVDDILDLLSTADKGVDDILGYLVCYLLLIRVLMTYLV